MEGCRYEPSGELLVAKDGTIETSVEDKIVHESTGAY